MFQRGQKIIILESSASKKMHPKARDIGYLDNMYLSTSSKFILLSAFFFQYEKDDKYDKNRVEKKKFIIDLGMKRDLKLDMSNGIPINYFTNRDIINLTSTGYMHGVERLIDYPLIHSNYGIWNNIKTNKKNNTISTHSSKELYKIPYGHISLFSSNKHNPKYKIEDKSNNEFIAWMKSMLPAVNSMFKIFHSYIETMTYKHEIVDSCFEMAKTRSKSFSKYIDYSFISGNCTKEMPASKYRLSKNIEKLEKLEKANIIKDINFISSLNNIFVQRLDLYYINMFKLKQYDLVRAYIRDLWSRKGILNESEIIIEIIPAIYIIRSILYRAMIMPCDIEEKINLIQYYLPLDWSVSLKDKIMYIRKMKLDADSDSSALNRVYRIVK